MISFNLSCDKEHEFDGWFSSSADFDGQLGKGLVACPVCDSQTVVKSLMSPQVATGRQKERVALATQNMARNEIVRQMKELRETMTDGAEDVGSRFPEEARKIHYGETEQRGIYGEANQEEVASLVEEGVEIVPLPTLPDEAN
ncbi:MAG: DUF1178 family protein [Rhizobiaceae bacterium]